LKHHVSAEFRACYRRLPAEVQTLADKSFALLKADLRHPSLHHKRVRDFHSVRVGLFHRALGVTAEDGILRIWIGTHAQYDKLVG
jgi:hypothetical protein